MFPIPEDFSPVNSNKPSDYWPLVNRGNNFDWEVISGVVLGQALHKNASKISIDKYRELCHDHFENLIDNDEVWSVIEKTYFINESFFNISPLFLLFKATYNDKGKLKLSADNLRMSKLFFGLMHDYKKSESLNFQHNFVEKELLNVLHCNLSDGNLAEGNETPYLPFISKLFQEDINFLISHPQYLLEQLTNLLKLYAFSYCSQLVMNVDKFKKGEPKSAKVYFILDSEKASSERSALKNFGYKTLKLTAEHVFPLLTSLEEMQIKGQKRRPLWQVYQEVLNYTEPQKVLDKFNEYLSAFSELRKLDPKPEAEEVEQVFDYWRELAIEQFKDLKTDRSDVNSKYLKQLELKVFSEFVQSRGPAGNTLVLNQDQLMLLTSLAIGQKEKLRLNELIKEFEARGFYFDNQSQAALVVFFERMGNVERMSDSGDAVYVRKTL